ncbi:MAG: hypothetical protein E7239_05445 [Sarcina sp.]|nr:hypothetical protein [Sarcina sp.]
MLINMGFSIEEIAERLGHESAAITWKTYAHLYPGKDRELAKRLEKARHASITGLQTSTAEQDKNEDNTGEPENLTSN